MPWFLRFGFALGAFVLVTAGLARADTIELPSHPLDRREHVAGQYRLARPPGSAAWVELSWTDDVGRLVMRHRIVVPPGTRAVPFLLDLRRAVTVRNHLQATLHVGGDTILTERDFTLRPRPGWQDFETILWQPQTPAAYAALPALGITAGMVFGTREGDPAASVGRAEPMRKAGLRWYVENIATDFYAAYHRALPGEAVNARFADVQRLHRQDPASLTPFMRNPSLSDPAWRARIATRLAQNVRAWSGDDPLYYDLGDETGIADLAAPWDFDFSPVALARFRRHLAAEYGTLAALNAEWQTNFRSWQAVMPMTTDQAMARPGENFAPWADFKAWMDLAFADALRRGTRSVHRADPTALSGIEGAQVPGWGGYDYTRLAHAADLVEAYENTDNVELLRSFNPRLILLMTLSGHSTADLWSFWHELLLGIRGLVLWDENGEVVRPDGTPGPWGTALQTLLAQVRGGLAATLAASRPEPGRVGILYSPASFRVEWMLRLRPFGPAWAERGAAREYDEDTPWRASMRRSAALLAHLGMSPRWLTPETLAGDGLRGLAALVLPQSLALSRRDIAAIRQFAAAGGIVLADGAPGRFDEHARLRAPPPFAPPGTAGSPLHDLAPFVRRSADNAGGGTLNDLARLLHSRIDPLLAVLTTDGHRATDVRTTLFRNGTTLLVALQRDRGTSGGEALNLVLDRPAFVTDLLARRDLGRAQRVPLRLGGPEPVILALSPEAPPAPAITGPRRARAGDIVHFAIAYPAADPLPRMAVRVALTDPHGALVPFHSGTVTLEDGQGGWDVPLALNAPAGVWHLTVADLLGREASTSLTVAPSP